MNVAMRMPMTLEQFLAWEERQELRYEFDGVQPIAMTGGTEAHSTIQANLIGALVTRLRGRPCKAHGSHLKIQVAGRVRYPDAFVTCTPIPPHATLATEPAVVFEILSDSTTEIDMIHKNGEYAATPSIKRYVILGQTSAAAITHRRQDENWVAGTVLGTEAVLALPEIGIEIPLAELYDGIDRVDEGEPATA